MEEPKIWTNEFECWVYRACGATLRLQWDISVGRQVVSELSIDDLKGGAQFVSLHQHSNRKVSDVYTERRCECIAYVNLFGHANGVFVETRYVYPDGVEKPFREIGYCPLKDGPWEQMSRIWVGQHYRRIPLQFFVTPEEAVAIVEYFCNTKGERWPGVNWIEEETMNWKLRVSPEDDFYDEREPQTRPVSQTSPTLDVIRERLDLAKYDEPPEPSQVN